MEVVVRHLHLYLDCGADDGSRKVGIAKITNGTAQYSDLFDIYGFTHWVNSLLRFYKLEWGLSHLGYGWLQKLYSSIHRYQIYLLGPLYPLLLSNDHLTEQLFGIDFGSGLKQTASWGEPLPFTNIYPPFN